MDGIEQFKYTVFDIPLQSTRAKISSTSFFVATSQEEEGLEKL